MNGCNTEQDFLNHHDDLVQFYYSQMVVPTRLIKGTSGKSLFKDFALLTFPPSTAVATAWQARHWPVPFLFQFPCIATNLTIITTPCSTEDSNVNKKFFHFQSIPLTMDKKITSEYCVIASGDAVWIIALCGLSAHLLQYQRIPPRIQTVL